MKTGASPNQPLFNQWYLGFVEKIIGKETLRRFYRIKIHKNEELSLQKIRQPKFFRKELKKPHEVVPLQFGPGVEFMIMIPINSRDNIPSASKY